MTKCEFQEGSPYFMLWFYIGSTFIMGVSGYMYHDRAEKSLQRIEQAVTRIKQAESQGEAQAVRESRDAVTIPEGLTDSKWNREVLAMFKRNASVRNWREAETALHNQYITRATDRYRYRWSRHLAGAN